MTALDTNQLWAMPCGVWGAKKYPMTKKCNSLPVLSTRAGVILYPIPTAAIAPEIVHSSFSLHCILQFALFAIGWTLPRSVKRDFFALRGVLVVVELQVVPAVLLEK